MQEIFLGADHAGLELKNKIKDYLIDNGYKVTDFGANVLNPEDDYPDFIFPVAKAISENPTNRRGITFGGSGQGEAMLANRIRGVRAAVYYGGSIDIIKLSREHNDANVLSFGARFVTETEAKETIKIWLREPVSSNPKYERRIKKAEEISAEFF